MNAKKTTVSLAVHGATHEFEFSHAERLLQMPRNGGWHLPEDSPFEFVDNALRRKQDKKGNSGEAKRRNTRPSEASSE